jgi:hypothetical protein
MLSKANKWLVHYKIDSSRNKNNSGSVTGATTGGTGLSFVKIVRFWIVGLAMLSFPSWFSP